jgi:hypothetical protein
MSDFNINIYNEVSNDYKKYNKDKNLTISNMLIYIKNNNMRILYINHLDLYINTLNIQKKTMQNIKNNIHNYDVNTNLIHSYINKLIE